MAEDPFGMAVQADQAAVEMEKTVNFAAVRSQGVIL
jgi:hypothetical protein